MLITVVTVCLNCEDVIETTIQSVVQQKNVQFEYLILDGCSVDNTVKIARKYANKYANMRIYSEKDAGIYDAMNKASKLAGGKYIYFLNAGDTFCHDEVLNQVSSYLLSNKDIYYGDINRGNQIESYPKKLRFTYLVLREKMVCHQAIFAKREILSDNPFDLSFKICADRDWLIQMIRQKKEMQYMHDVTVANYDCNGVSSNYAKFDKDSINIAKKYGGMFTIFFIKMKRMIGKLRKLKR